ncbi:MAG: FAD-binding oxidoreductase [Acidobacteria bacterium]|nr:FAD-binding oxidoreductase [Acidobacteriota bacterium]
MSTRREFGARLIKAVAGYAIATGPLLRSLEAQTGLPIGDLRSSLGAGDGVILTPDDSKYTESYNLRTRLVPEVRVLCQSAKGVAATILWAKANKVSFSTRGAGHCYEDFSQNLKLVIDTRKLTASEWGSNGLLSVGSGTTLGSLYKLADARGRAFPGGSCPTVGVAGHCMGGGYGRLSRPLGLACDNVTSFEIVDARGKILTTSATQNSDLFWALRGSGGGSFGVVTKFTFQTHSIGKVSTYSASWTLGVSEAVKVFRAWQSWAPHAPNEITSTMTVSKGGAGKIRLHSSGQSTGSETKLRNEVTSWAKGAAVSTKTRTSMEAIDLFAGTGGWVLNPVYMKGRSDYVKKPMSEEGVAALMNEMLKLSVGAISAMCDAYGGKIAEPEADAMAFAHRDALYSIQYYSQWSTASQTSSKLAMSRAFYKALRPYVSGYAYVNYPDLELPDYARAYWGDNLPRLQQIKQKYDPDNLFRHKQSVPLPGASLSSSIRSIALPDLFAFD